MASAAAPKILVHHMPHSRSTRIIWLLEEIGLKYTVKVHYWKSDGFPMSTLRQVSALAKAPVVIYNGETMTESGFIISHLLAAFPRPQLQSPPSPSSSYWSHFSEGSLMPFLTAARAARIGLKHLENGGKPGPHFDPVLSQEGADGMRAMEAWVQGWARMYVEDGLGEVNAFLAKQPNFSSEKDKIGEGDFMMMFPLNTIAYGGKKRLYELGKSSIGWVDRIRERQAWIAAQERIKYEEETQRPQALK